MTDCARDMLCVALSGLQKGPQNLHDWRMVLGVLESQPFVDVEMARQTLQHLYTLAGAVPGLLSEIDRLTNENAELEEELDDVAGY